MEINFHEFSWPWHSYFLDLLPITAVKQQSKVAIVAGAGGGTSLYRRLISQLHPTLSVPPRPVHQLCISDEITLTYLGLVIFKVFCGRTVPTATLDH